MANTKEYKIVINGITESVKAVESLNKELNELEARIKALEGKSVGVKASGGGGGSSSSKASLSEEEKLAKQIEQIDAKRVAYSKEIYQNYLAAKDVLKETVTDQKSIAASERLQANSYSNTIQGMKQELADIKSAMQTVDLGDTDKMDAMVKRANELNEALKKIEESYGQFGRNVGNYKDSLNNITVVIGGVAREFKNSREALRSLKQELDSLSASEKGNTDYAKKLRREYNKLKSAIDDATKSSKFMDEALDTMQSFTSLNQVSQGFSTFFGIDNSEIEKQIARLVALQNALQGLEKISKQIDSEEGIGKWLSKGSRGIDSFVTKITGAQKRMGLFVGQTKTASIAINGFAKVLKGVGAVGITGGVMLLADVFGKMIERFQKWVNGGIEAGDAAKILESKLTTLANVVNRLQKENSKSWFENQASDVAYMANNVNNLNNQLLQVLDDLGKLEKYKKNDKLLLFGNTDTLSDAQLEFKKLTQLIEENDKKAEKSILPSLFNDIKDAVTGLKRNYKELGESLLNDFLYRSKDVIERANNEVLKTKTVSKETATEIKDLVQEMNENFATNSVLNNVEKFSENGTYYAAQIDFVKNALERLNNSVNENTLNPDYMVQLRIDAMKDGAAKIKAQNELNRKREIDAANGNIEAIKLINKKYAHELSESLKSINNAYMAALNDLNSLRIQNMREGLAKQLAQLEQEKKEKIQAIKQDGYLVGERILEVNRLYDQKLLDAKRDWAYQVKKVYEDLYAEIENINRETFGTEVQTSQINVENKARKKRSKAGYDEIKDEWYGAAGPPIHSVNINKRKEYYDELLKIDTDASERMETIRNEELAKELEFNQKQEKLRHENVADAKTTSLIMEELAKYEKEKGVPLMPDAEDFDWGATEEKLRSELSKLRGELVDAYNSGELDFKNFVDLIQKEQEAHNAKMNALEKENAAQSEENTQKSIEERKELVNRYYQDLLSSMRQRQDDIAEITNNTPIINNDWGVVEISNTKRHYELAERAYKEFASELVETKGKLRQDLSAKKITPEDFFMRIEELEALIKAVREALNQVEAAQKGLVADFLQSIEQYIRAGLDSFQTIMSAVWDAQDVQFDKEQEQLDKLNEELDKKLDEQQEIVQQHKSAIDSIEDELASSRGDRRQHLIDQLNAEMAAQRAAQKQEQKIQKEKEAAQKKQDALEKKRKKAEYERNMIQAIVNGAMAVTYAAMNSWPVPAIPMMALAAATTAAQVAIMASNKPYAKGGQLEGPSHKEGGIKVPGIGNGIELEGKEYVIRKKTSESNLGLLDFINRSERKLNLDDFIDFYTSGKIKKNISSMSPRTRFAEGGTIPTITNDYAFDDRLLTAFEDYSNRPVYVSVVDINNRQDAVKNVQVLAGIE